VNQHLWVKVQGFCGLGFKVFGLGFRYWGLGFKVLGLATADCGPTVQGILVGCSPYRGMPPTTSKVDCIKNQSQIKNQNPSCI
jgi:hypothetical protein